MTYTPLIVEKIKKPTNPGRAGGTCWRVPDIKFNY